MPIRIKTDLEWGKVFYLKADREQFEHLLTGIIVLPGDEGKTKLKFILSYMGETITVYDFECSEEIDQRKILDIEEED